MSSLSRLRGAYLFIDLAELLIVLGEVQPRVEIPGLPIDANLVERVNVDACCSPPVPFEESGRRGDA